MTTMAHRLFAMGVPITEKIVRTVAVYVGLLLLLRMAGRRTAAQLNSFDLVVLLLISNVVQNAIIGPDDSLLGGLIGVAVLIFASDGIIRLVRRNEAIDRATEGTETRLVEDGAFVERELRRLGIRVAELDVALRRQGADHVAQVRRADLYPSGAIVVDLLPEARGASVEDVGRLERKLDQLASNVARLGAAGS